MSTGDGRRKGNTKDDSESARDRQKGRTTMIVRVNRKNGYELYDCESLAMCEMDHKLVEFRLADRKEELVTLEIGEDAQVYVMNDLGQTIAKYCI